jgi:Cyclic nucleotide-binding domain/TLC ATP/ADP transporter
MMLKIVDRWLKIYEDEIGLFLWTFALFFLVRSSGIILNNYAETAFLKRYGVEYLPIVNMINAIATFFIMGVVAIISGKVRDARLLQYLFIFCGITVAAIRFSIPLDFDLIYPLLFMLKSQYEVLLALLFWNLANDLFNTRQSKRLFPLIMAGGVLGQILGSFGTPFLARRLSFDNLLLVYMVAAFMGAAVVKGLSASYPALIFKDTRSKGVKKRTPMMEEIKKALPLIRESTLVKILVVLTFMPNVIVPILNYQFNFAVNDQFATESGMIQFFGYFRGVLNMISLIILLFVGRIYGRWGLPVALMFHPFNYLLAFLAFLLRFDIFSALYARLSTNVLRTTINVPAMGVLMGLFPESYRGLMRPFLRGTVVRVGLFLGSGLILASQGLFHPRYLSLVALPFVLTWTMAPFFLKKGYSKILLDLISRNMLDLKGLEGKAVGAIFKDKTIQSQLVESFCAARGEECLWHARLLKSLAVDDLDSHILSALEGKEERTQIALVEMLSSDAGESAVGVMKGLINPEKPDLKVAIIKTANRLGPEFIEQLDIGDLIHSTHPEVRGYAAAALFREDHGTYRKLIDSWLASEDISERKSGVIAAGESGDCSYWERLKALLEEQDDQEILPFILTGLGHLGAPQLNEVVAPFLFHPEEAVRLAALGSVEVRDDAIMRDLILLLGDPSDEIHELAKNRIESAPYVNGQLLIECLNVPRRRVREGLFELLESLDIKGLEVFRFARARVEAGYSHLVEADAVGRLPEAPARDLLVDHLLQKKDLQLENTLRVLAAQDPSGRMKLIFRGVFSSDSRQRANALEALDDIMDSALKKIMIPLIENASTGGTLAVGRKHFELPRLDSDREVLISRLLGGDDWVTTVLTLSLVNGYGLVPAVREILNDLMNSQDPHIRRMVTGLMKGQADESGKREKSMRTDSTIPGKILLLKGIEIFEGLAVGELAAVASVTEEVDYPKGEIVIREGDSGETMYLIIEGEVSVLKKSSEGPEIELDRIGSGDYFGEMALFEDVKRSATIRTREPSRVLVLHKREFEEIVREYPLIALHICKILSGRIRKLHEKVKESTAEWSRKTS